MLAETSPVILRVCSKTSKSLLIKIFSVAKREFAVIFVIPVSKIEPSVKGSDFPAISQKNQHRDYSRAAKEDQVQSTIGHFRPVCGKPG